MWQRNDRRRHDLRARFNPSQRFHAGEYGRFSPRPYQLAQVCDGSINECALALFVRWYRDTTRCCEILYRQAYLRERTPRWNEIIAAAEWQGVAYPAEWNAKSKAGMRAQVYLTRKLSLRLHGDVGGFGISDDSSDLSWQALGLLGYDFTRHFALLAGYRALSADKDVGSGSNQKGADAIMKGAVLALDFH